MKILLLVITSVSFITNIVHAGGLDMNRPAAKSKQGTYSSQYVRKPELVITEFRKNAETCSDTCPTSRSEAGVAKLRCDILVTVKNNGGDAGYFKVALHYKDVKWNAKTMSVTASSGLKAGKSKTFKFEPRVIRWFSTGYKFTAEVDSTKKVRESNEGNNLSVRKSF